MPTDTALADALRATYSPAELAALHQRLVEELDHADEITADDPLGRLCDALHTAAYAPTAATSASQTTPALLFAVAATHGTRA